MAQELEEKTQELRKKDDEIAKCKLYLDSLEVNLKEVKDQHEKEIEKLQE